MLNNIMLRYSAPNFTYISHDMWKVQAEIHLHNEVSMTLTEPIYMKPELALQLW
jgi:hypothetical protein